jgi:hypothetical protein
MPQNICAEAARKLVELMVRATAQQVPAIRAATTQRLTAQVKGYLEAGNRVIIVSHSQGNFFANDIFAGITQNRNGLKIVGVAVPPPLGTTAAPNAQSYVTYNDDWIIKGVPGAAPPNAQHAPACGLNPICGIGAHLFVEAYWKDGSQGRTKIDGLVNAALQTLPFPTPIIGNGIIAATLRWDSQPDVDLHVFEPNGTHVYYAARSGSSGALDRDDVDSQGPENYVVCDDGDVQDGSYRIGVNYFSGSGPSTASVLVRAGNPQDSRDSGPIVLPTPRGSGGNASPLPVASVRVFRDGNGLRKYEILNRW